MTQRVLAKHYAFTDEELDFILNDDIKYRLGQDAEREGEELFSCRMPSLPLWSKGKSLTTCSIQRIVTEQVRRDSSSGSASGSRSGRFWQLPFANMGSTMK